MAGRNLLAQNQNIKQKQEAGIYILGWASWFLAVVGGMYAATSWIGNTINFFINLIPWDYAPHALLAVGAVATFLDLLGDLTPNQAAVTSAILAPTIAVSINDSGHPAQLAQRIEDWSTALQGTVGGHIADWVGNIGAGGLGLVCIAVAVIVSKRVLAKQSAAAGGGGR